MQNIKKNNPLTLPMLHIKGLYIWIVKVNKLISEQFEIFFTYMCKPLASAVSRLDSSFSINQIRKSFASNQSVVSGLKGALLQEVENCCQHLRSLGHHTKDYIVNHLWFFQCLSCVTSCDCLCEKSMWSGSARIQ